MTPFTLQEIADVTGGRARGEATVSASATLDSRQVLPGGLFVALAGERVDGHDYVAAAIRNGAVAVLSSRPVDAPGVLVDDVTRALGLLASENLRRVDVPVVAVTGSQGKTSVKDLLAHVLEAAGQTVATAGNFNNELGVPLTVLRADARTAHLVVEMGARGVGHIADLCRIAPPTIGAVLNVGHAHVGEFGSPERIAQAKGELVEALPHDGVAVLNADDPLVAPMRSRTRARVLTFGRTGDVAIGRVTLDGTGSPRFALAHDGVVVDVRVPQIGVHHAMNAAAAAAVALAAGIDLETIAARLATARSASPMRMERHERADGLVVVNDAYNANPESMAAALRAVAAIADSRGIAVLGEMLELGDDADESHRQIGRLAAELGFVRVIAVGEGARLIAEGAGAVGELVDDVDEATLTLSASLSGNEVVLVKASRGARLERVAHGLLQA